MQQTQHIKPVSLDCFVLACDGYAYVVIQSKIERRPYYYVDDFLKDEMLMVCHLEEPSMLEIKDKDDKLIHPFMIKGRSLVLSPFFFGKGYRLFSNGKCIQDLSLDFWCTNSGDMGLIVN